MTEIDLLLLPGLHGTSALFRPLLDHLPPHLRPTALSYPSDKPLGYEELLPIVLGALPRSSPFVLLAESFSGPLAIMAAATRPPGLCAVVLCATFVRNPLWFRASWLRHFVHPVFYQFYPAYSGVKRMLAGNSTAELRALAREALRPVRPAVLAHRVRAVLQVNVLEQLRSCPVPILYLRGDRDRVVPAHNMAEIAAACPSVRIECIQAPHMVLQTQPAAAAAVIRDFLQQKMTSS